MTTDLTTAGEMMALRAHTRGGPEQLTYERAPRPRAAAGEIVVAVGAAAITFAELSWPETWEADGVDRTPTIPSHEFAGVVAEVGEGVTGLSIGDSVFGLVPFNRDGAAAEYVAVPVSDITKKDASVSDLTAAAAVLPALTAWEALRDHAPLATGQRLLVRGGIGAVGSFLTQFAHELGIEVTVTITSAAGEERARALGASHIVVTDRNATEWPDLSGFDAAIDAVGAVPEWMYAAVRPGGQLLGLQEEPNAELAAKYGMNAMFFVVATDPDRLQDLARLLASGTLDVPVAQTFPLAEGRAAYESRAHPNPVPGKTVILIR
ncbi:NADP-dependent oxidoreductase [Microbacterium maritypicum]|uniref:NADP-dependent oxidoreductase n=1 Tax=Microbacterium maritypicum TaxID=33918 RepID=UPI0038016155